MIPEGTLNQEIFESAITGINDSKSVLIFLSPDTEIVPGIAVKRRYQAQVAFSKGEFRASPSSSYRLGAIERRVVISNYRAEPSFISNARRTRRPKPFPVSRYSIRSLRIYLHRKTLARV